MDIQEEDTIDELFEKVPCRNEQIKLLSDLFGEPSLTVFPSIFIYGHTSTGKTTVIRSVLTLTKCQYIIVDCIEFYTARLLFENILNEFAGSKPSVENNFSVSLKCDNLNDFVRYLRSIINDFEHPDHTVYLVFDHAERLRDMNINLLPALLRLQELSSLNICVVMLSEIVWEKYRTGTGFVEPLRIHFPDYNSDELLKILSLDCPENYETVFYRQYLSLLFSVFHFVCRDIRELAHLARLNFPKYIEPVENDEINQSDTRKLWRSIEPHLKKALQTVYLREVSSNQWEQMQNSYLKEQESTQLVSKSPVELPFYGKYLLIAAYLASYNPAKCDKRFFVRRTEKLSKRAKLAGLKKNERTSNQLLGPKPFPHDRLLAIFYSIVEGKVAPTAHIFTQISSLVTHGLMIKLATADLISSPKYKCIVSLEFIKGIGKTVNFEVPKYLYDFV